MNYYKNIFFKKRLNKVPFNDPKPDKLFKLLLYPFAAVFSFSFFSYLHNYFKVKTPEAEEKLNDIKINENEIYPK